MNCPAKPWPRSATDCVWVFGPICWAPTEAARTSGPAAPFQFCCRPSWAIIAPVFPVPALPIPLNPTAWVWVFGRQPCNPP